MIRMFLSAFGLTLLITGSGLAGEADVVDVSVRQSSGGSYSFDVAVRHADEGWEHYADAWDVTGSDGTVYATRILVHPHVNEQPFTRGKSGVEIPQGVKSVIIRARDKVHQYGGKTMEVALPGR